MSLPKIKYLRLWDILGDKKRNIEPLYPVGKTTWWEGVKSGKYPKPMKLGARITVWKEEDIAKLMKKGFK